MLRGFFGVSWFPIVMFLGGWRGLTHPFGLVAAFVVSLGVVAVMVFLSSRREEPWSRYLAGMAAAFLLGVVTYSGGLGLFVRSLDVECRPMIAAFRALSQEARAAVASRGRDALPPGFPLPTTIRGYPLTIGSTSSRFDFDLDEPLNIRIVTFRYLDAERGVSFCEDERLSMPGTMAPDWFLPRGWVCYALDWGAGSALGPR